METINKVLHFPNKLDFVGFLERVDYEKINCIKKVLTDDFQDVNSEKLLNLVSALDDLHILYITQHFQDVQILTNVLRDEIFMLVKEKMEDE